MTINKYHISSHAAQRMAQRNLNSGDVSLIMRYGSIEYRAGAKFYFLRQRDIPAGMERQLERLVGATLVTDGDEVLTVYRNRRALHAIRRKRKLRIRILHS